ncbi:serine/threonine kinase [Aureococcus anophagefferens]|nr:serine/threonine kinase [Aureococcus anophagefferens]
MGLKDFEILHRLGKGSFGTVYKCRRVSDGEIYAMKRVNISHMKDAEIGDALTEIRVLASVRHRNVVPFLESFVEKGRELVLVLDFCDGGDLAAVVEQARKARRLLGEAKIWHYAVQLVDGLRYPPGRQKRATCPTSKAPLSAVFHSYLHGRSIVHRDVKPANAFLTAKGEVRIGDLNVSKIVKDDKGGLMKTQIAIGTPYYMAPEIWADRPYSRAADVWALGCTVYELCCLRPPFHARSVAALGKAVRSGRRDAIPRTYSRELRDFVDGMLQVNASKRPSIDALAASEVLCSKRGRDGDVAPEDDADRIELLKTIKVPRSKHQLTHALPKPCYPDSRPNSPAAWPATNRARKTELLQRRESSRHSFAENPSPASTEGSSALDAAIARVDELLGRKAAPLSPSRKAAKVAPVAFDGGSATARRALRGSRTRRQLARQPKPNWEPRPAAGARRPGQAGWWG